MSTVFTYNSADLPVTMTYPDGKIVNFAYNNNMLPTSVSGTSTYAQSIAYDSANRMIQMIRGANKINSVYTYNAWNVDGGRLQNLTSTQVSTGDPLQNQTYDYDSVGNINTITDSLSGPQTQTFTYDELDRLLSSSVTGGTDGLYTEGYSYDSATGNLASKNNVNYSAYDANHKHAVTSLSNGNSYGYDQNGNMTSRHVLEETEFKDYTLNYDAENRLVSVSGNATASFAYDGDGKQVKATVNGVTAVYVGQHYEVKNSVVTKYYFAGATRIAVRTDGTLRFLLGDHLGSSSVTTNMYGTRTASALYKAFGETRYTLGNLNTDYKFTGQREESALGIYFFNARWYDGSLGRFLSPDTIVPTSTQGTQAWDRYAFVNNNPVRYTDPTGHCAQDIEPEECEFMKSHQTEGGGVAGTSSGDEGGGECGHEGQDSCYNGLQVCRENICHDDGGVTDISGTLEDPAVIISGSVACLATGLCFLVANEAGWALLKLCANNATCWKLFGYGLATTIPGRPTQNNSSQTVVLGNMPSNIEMGKSLQMEYYYVQTGYSPQANIVWLIDRVQKGYSFIYANYPPRPGSMFETEQIIINLLRR